MPFTTQQISTNPDLNLDQGFLMSKIGGGMSDHAQGIIETTGVVTSSAVKTSVVGGGASILGKFTGLDPVTIIGLAIGLLGLLVSVFSFLINWHYKKKEDQRADQLHKIALRKANGECNVE